jgi:hypothetical protein
MPYACYTDAIAEARIAAWESAIRDPADFIRVLLLNRISARAYPPDVLVFASSGGRRASGKCASSGTAEMPESD